MSEITKWLQHLGLEKYADQFRAAEIDLEIVPNLTDADLKELGLPLGPRKKILNAIDSGVNINSTQGSERFPNRGVETKFIPHSPERRHLTVMFCDLIGSTQLSEQYDPEDLTELIRCYHEYCNNLIASFNGYVARYMGDGILAYFGYPIASENDAEHAVEAALAICSGISKLEFNIAVQISLRVGIASGRVVVGETIGEGISKEHTVVGETPNLAARLQSLAAENSVVISESTKRLLGNLFDIQGLGEQNIRGLSRPVNIYQVNGKGWVPSRFGSKTKNHIQIIGRQEYLTILQTLWEACLDGRGQTAVLSGEAGIGKSRLVQNIIGVAGNESAKVLELQCSPLHQNTALYPVVRLISELGRLAQHDNGEEKLEALYQVLFGKQDGREVEIVVLASLFDLEQYSVARFGNISLSSAQSRTRMFAALTEWLLEYSNATPLLLVLEDCHWIDPTTREWILSVMVELQSRQIFLLMTTRPDTKEWRFPASAVTQLALSRLSHSQVMDFIDALSTQQPLTLAARESISMRADGNPLFLEELTKAILELPGPGGIIDDETTIPISLQDSLMSRLDRLGHLVKKIAQTAACIGREFPLTVLSKTMRIPDDEITNALTMLCESEILYIVQEVPHPVYQFKHALLRDSAYASLLRSNRRSIHEKIFSILSKSDSVASEALAIHAEGAGLIERSAYHFEEAGDQAMSRSALAEAQRHYRHTVELYGKLPEEPKYLSARLATTIKLVYACQAAYGYAHESTITALKDADQLIGSVDNPELEFSYIVANWGRQIAIGEPDKAILAANRAVDSKNLTLNPIQQSIINCCRAMGFMMAGSFAEANMDFEQAQHHYRSSKTAFNPAQQSVEQGIRIRSIQSLGLICQGFESDAFALLHNIEEDAISLRHPATHGFAVYWQSMANDLAQKPERRKSIDNCLSVIAELELTAWKGPAKCLQAAMMRDAGEIENSAKAFDLAFLENKRAGWSWMLSYYQALQMSNLIFLERESDAQELIQQIVQRLEFGAEQWANAEVLRLLAVAHTKSDPVEAQRWISQSINIAKSQSSRLWWLRSACSLFDMSETLGIPHEECLQQLDSAVGSYPSEGENSADWQVAVDILQAHEFNKK